MSDSPRTVLFFGPQGSGKGTQVELLAAFLREQDQTRQPLVVETGDAFRNFAAADSYTSKRTKEALEEGNLLPAALSVWLWTGMLVDGYTGAEHLVFDGFPRRVAEAKMLDSLLQFYGRAPVSIVTLEISEETALDRLRERGRADDTSDAQIMKRLEWYKREVLPVVDYFRANPERYEVLTIDGEKPVAAVHSNVREALGFSGSA